MLKKWINTSHIKWPLILALLGWLMVSGPSPLQAQKPVPTGPATARPGADQDTWGIRILHLRPVARNHLLDLRFQVTDRDKAAFIMSRNHKAYLVDQRTGKALPVPVTKSGSMRQTTLKPEKGREYFMFFSNPGHLVKTGDLMTLAIGDIRFKDIRLEEPGTPLDGEGLARLQQGRIAAWQAERKKMREEFEPRRLQCQENNACLQQLDRQLADQEKREYKRLVYNKAESDGSP